VDHPARGVGDLAPIVVAGCADRVAPTSEPVPSPTPDPLDGTSWRAVTLLGRPPVPGREPTIAFADGRATGTTGCNSYGGAYRLEGATIEFEELVSTKIACEPAVAQVELAFLHGLGGSSSASLDVDGRLVLSGDAGQLVFARA